MVGFRVRGRVEGSEQDIGFRVSGLGPRDYGLGCGRGRKLGFRGYLGCRV